MNWNADGSALQYTPVLCVPDSQAVELLAHYKIMSAPVRDVSRAPGTPWNFLFLGVVGACNVHMCMRARACMCTRVACAGNLTGG